MHVFSWNKQKFALSSSFAKLLQAKRKRLEIEKNMALEALVGYSPSRRHLRMSEEDDEKITDIEKEMKALLPNFESNEVLAKAPFNNVR